MSYRPSPRPSLLCALAVLVWANTACADRRVVAYVPTWVDLKSFAGTIDYPKITHINVAFANPVNDEGDLSFDEKIQFLSDKARGHHVKVLISVGGGSASSDKKLMERYFRLIDDSRRAGFTSKIWDYVSAHHFDGVDVDIEGPSINKDYGAFIRDLSTSPRRKAKLLTAALSQGYGGSRVPDSLFPQFDFVNIMAYDATGYWDPKSPGQHSSLEFTRASVKYWLERGLPRDKAVLGVPFYGYGFGEAYRKRDYPYSEIVASHPGAEALDQVGSTIWYNGIPTIRAKSKYVADNQLGGVMIWSLDCDAKGDRSLLSVIYDTLNGGALTPSRRKR